MGHITFITGGQRSGKSSFAQQLAEQKSDNPVYLATARVWDNDFKERIKRHQDDRGEQWDTIEEPVNISKHNLSGRTILLDCITLWLTNIFHDNDYQWEIALHTAKKEWQKFIKQDFELIVVSNEVGMSLHAGTDMARKFTDLQGFINQFIASLSDEVYLMVSGIPVKIK